jgi:hypothetical protein
MSRREMYSALALMGVLMAAWMLSGCGDAPTAPSLHEDMTSMEAAAGSGDATVFAAPPGTARGGPRGVPVAALRIERQFDLAVVPDRGARTSRRPAGSAELGSGRGASSRYALASSQM